MISTADRHDWQRLRDELHGFISRRVSSRADADDILQETFVRVQRGLSQLKDDEAFGGWIYRVARNTLADHLRAKSRTVPAFENEREEDDREAEACVAAYLGTIIPQLPPVYREAITLTELEGKSQVDAAKQLGISVSGMKSRVQRGRQKLAAMIETCCTIEVDARGHVISCESRTTCTC